MVSLSFLVITAMTVIIISLIFLLLQESFVKLLYGDRRKKIFLVDIRKSKNVTLDKERKTFQYQQKDHTWRVDREYNGCACYVSTQVEPLNVCADMEKWKFWIDTDEFQPVFRNRIIQNLMLSKEKNMVMLAVILSGIACLVCVIVYLKISGLESNIEAIKNSVNVLNSIKPAIVG